MPQFYTIIDDPKLNLKAKIKKQAINIKRQTSSSFDEAIVKKRQRQQ